MEGTEEGSPKWIFELIFERRKPGWCLNKYDHIPFGTLKVTYNIQMAQFNSSLTRLFTFCLYLFVFWTGYIAQLVLAQHT